MTVTITEQNPIMQDTNAAGDNGFYYTGERAPVAGDNIQSQYQKVWFSNGKEDYLPLVQGNNVIEAAVNETLANLNSDNPPTNWVPRPGYIPPSS